MDQDKYAVPPALAAGFKIAIADIARECHLMARSKGFWDDPVINVGEKIALMHSELSEALEASRHGDPGSEAVPGLSSMEEELADTLIRILDFGHARGYDLGNAVIRKMEYNATRGRKHGKLF